MESSKLKHIKPNSFRNKSADGRIIGTNICNRKANFNIRTIRPISQKINKIDSSKAEIDNCSKQTLHPRNVYNRNKQKVNEKGIFSLYTRDFELVNDGYAPVIIRSIKIPQNSDLKVKYEADTSNVEIMHGDKNSPDICDSLLQRKGENEINLIRYKIKASYISRSILLKKKNSLTKRSSIGSPENTQEFMENFTPNQKSKLKIDNIHNCTLRDFTSTLEIKAKNLQSSYERKGKATEESKRVKTQKEKKNKISSNKNTEIFDKKLYEMINLKNFCNNLKKKKITNSPREVIKNIPINVSKLRKESVKENIVKFSSPEYLNQNNQSIFSKYFWAQVDKDGSMKQTDNDQDLDDFLNLKQSE